MFNVASSNDLRESVRQLLEAFGVNDSKFVFTFTEVNTSTGSIKLDSYTLTSDACATCAAMILGSACMSIEDGVRNGTLTEHAMPALYGNSETIN